MASAAGVTEKPIAHQNQQQQVVKCPRCHSSNTKFCYYNNYSLSQPRHFCKGCKRYWTRGGTLRNVPVGGGCRKNKRIKRPPPTTIRTPHDAANSVTVGHDPNTNLDHVPSSAPSNSNVDHRLSPLLYGLLPQNPKYPRLDSRVSNHVNDTHVSRFDLLQPHMSYPGLEFSSSDPGASVANQVHNSYSLVSSYPSMFSGGSTSLCTSDPMMASLLASSLQQQPRFLGFGPYGDGSGSVVKNVQMEGTQNMMYGNNNFHSQNASDQIKAVESSDPTSFLWSTAGGDGGDWLDPASNIGSSVPSLI